MSIAEVSVQQPAEKASIARKKALEAALAAQPARQRLGRVISVSDTQLLILIEAPDGGFEAPNKPRVGMHVCIEGDGADIIATISAMSAPNMGHADDWTEVMIAEVELVGEIVFSQRQSDDSMRRVFRRGIEKYPTLGQVSAFMSKDDLQCVYGIDQDNQVNIGHISHNTDLPVTFNWGKLCTGNFGIFGTAGTGKSCALVKIVRAVVMSRHPASIVILDVNNEYSRSFGKAAENIDLSAGALPYWLLNKDEISAILGCGGQDLTQEEYSILEEAISATRRNFRHFSAGAQGAKARVKANNNLDIPYPYSLAQLVNHIDQIAASTKPTADTARQLGVRLRLAADNREFECFFGSGETAVHLEKLMSRLFRLPKLKKPISIVRLASLTGTALDVAVSVIARLAFAVGKWGNGKAPLLLCVDDAHRFMPVDPDHEQIAAKALSQCVEMGQKYGMGVGLVSSRPRVMNRVSLDQLDTLIAMRLPNQADQALLDEIAPEVAHGMLSSVGTLNAAEAIALGYGVMLPMRLKFDALGKEALPRGDRNQIGVREDVERREVEQAAGAHAHFVNEIIDNWRG